ncbi:MAG: CocE/NonD family hydrolase [Dactylosporangium sp.]|nr:CocE/NonD family hydrolase [Dactylosporangium sp.]NNJ60412.1 CocE/NonD family hydrolase [Dactylosporangium sp.]
MSSVPGPRPYPFLTRMRPTRRRMVGSGVGLLLIAALAGWVAWPEPVRWHTHDFMITVPTGPDNAAQVTLDATLYLPTAASARHRVPAILLAHGFGGTKQTVAAEAEDYAGRGYAVLAWTAQGFGRSTGQIHLDSIDWEVKDAQRLVDWLAARPEIATQAPGDPRVAVVGGSYGGGLALLLAGVDSRIDAIVPMITWNDLSRSFFPEATGGPATDGVFKRAWAGIFLGTGGGAGDAPAAGGAGDSGRATRAAAVDPQCGRFAPEICEAYLRIAARGRADAAAVALLDRSSPATVVDQITAPTLLIQGTADSLFPLSEADANARAVAENGTPVRVAWYTGGHDGGEGPASDTDRLMTLILEWLDHYLRGTGPAPADDFTYSRVTGFDVTDRGIVTSAYSVDAYPGLAGGTGGGTAPGTIPGSVAGPVQHIANPAAGTPGALSSLPSAGDLASYVSGLVTEVPGQHADYYSQPLETAADVVGAPTVRVRAASPTGEAVLFAKLYDVDRHGESTLPNGLIAPIRLTGLPTDLARARPVTVTLPAIVHRFAAGHRLRVTLSTSDQAYATPAEPTVYSVAVEPEIMLPGAAGVPMANPDAVWRRILAGLAGGAGVAVALAVAVARRRTRRASRLVVAEHVDTPLVVRGLRKEYADGFRAVSAADFTVRRGQVVGLLGPNGAGKTTALRVLMGLTRPTAGEVLVFGHRVVPGASVLARAGALVEGPGFLPHLSGAANLRLYWKTTGRPERDSSLAEVLEIAGLGDAVNRRVRTYSHGMRQRLAIAQAMLGLPELLVLDEPTDGLDPPQIAEMRQVLRRYAADGRAVLVSSHLLAEVEQTCTDVIVMNQGRVVATGAVNAIVGDSPIVRIDVSDQEAAAGVLARLATVRSVERDGDSTVVVHLDHPDLVRQRAELVEALVKAGIGVEKVIPRRRLEDAFLALVGGDTTAGGER